MVKMVMMNRMTMQFYQQTRKQQTTIKKKTTKKRRKMRMNHILPLLLHQAKRKRVTIKNTNQNTTLLLLLSLPIIITLTRRHHQMHFIHIYHHLEEVLLICHMVNTHLRPMECSRYHRIPMRILLVLHLLEKRREDGHVRSRFPKEDIHLIHTLYIRLILMEDMVYLRLKGCSLHQCHRFIPWRRQIHRPILRKREVMMILFHCHRQRKFLLIFCHLIVIMWIQMMLWKLTMVMALKKIQILHRKQIVKRR
mmetsp:Transcript_16364/g.24298  ORF Transcript_16364/g.24298 Transcript_16364/m.24298 type:complete len:251 (-) Transcript_16364:218-970(-)